MGYIPQSYFRSPEGKKTFRASVEAVERALDERIAIGDLTPLVTETVPNPIQYIGLVATEIAKRTPTLERGEA